MKIWRFGDLSNEGMGKLPLTKKQQMTDTSNETTTVAVPGIMEATLAKVRQAEKERDRDLVNYYKSMMGRKDVSYSQWRVCVMALEFLFRKGYTSITTPGGVKKRLTKLGVIKSDKKD